MEGVPMKLLKMFTTVILAVAIFLSGCSGNNPTAPAPIEPLEPVETQYDGSHNLLGLYTFICDPATESIDIIQLRGTDFHLNALRFLEPPPNLYLKLIGPLKFNGNILNIDIGITHPFLAMKIYTGFDVCGIIFTHGSYSGFHNPEIVMAGPGDTRLLNADGYSRWWNPGEFAHGHTMFNYIDGLLGRPDDVGDYNCTLNGYKYYADGLQPKDPLTVLDPAKRGVFNAGKLNIRHYTMDLSGGLIFNYAIDACWHMPVGDPPYIPPDSFPPEANRPEAWGIRATEVYNTLFYDDASHTAGGHLKLQVDLFDHFNCDENQLWGESMDGLAYGGMAAPLGGNDEFSTYELDFSGVNLKHSGTGELLITALSEVVGYPPMLPDTPLCAYFPYVFSISPVIPEHSDGWARTWGEGGSDRGFGVAADSQGNSYTTGYFRDYVDFDPGDGECILSAVGNKDTFLSKFDPYGQFLWARTWGSTSSEQSYSVDVDSMDCSYTSGYFNQTVDFDPGDGVEERTAIENDDAFLSKFDPDGNFQWVAVFGGLDDETAYFVHIDDWDNVYVGGYFDADIDLDPGPGVDLHNSLGNSDIFLVKLDTFGNFIWGRSWGGPKADRLYAVAADLHGNVFTTGYYTDSVDLDPGDGSALYISNGGSDVYLTKFNSNGVFKAALSWGGPGSDRAEGISVGPNGEVYVAGNYYDTIDFDPGSGVDEHTSNGGMDIFISKFDPSLTHEWTLCWGSGSGDDTHAMSVRGGNVFATGHFNGSMDIDPTEGVDMRTTHGGSDVYLIKLDCYADYVWARTWGGSGGEYSRGFAADDIGNLFLTGGFGSSNMDFDPGPAEEIHEYGGGGDVYLIKMLPDGYW